MKRYVHLLNWLPRLQCDNKHSLGMKAQITAHFFSACSDEQTHVNLFQWRPWFESCGLQEHSCHKQHAWWLCAGHNWDSCLWRRHCHPGSQVATAVCFGDVAVATVWNGDSRSFSLPAYYWGEHVKQWQKRVLATDSLSYQLFNEQCVEASPHFQSIEIL